MKAANVEDRKVYKAIADDYKQPQNGVVLLAQKILKTAGKQDPVVLMQALLLCMRTIDAAHNGPRKMP